MPEYLSPGVYVEEVSTGSKPIEGVSTSTVGMIGVAERGPENVPILVTSIGSYNRVYGGQLHLADFTVSGQVHGYLPYAVNGFFANGGRRVFVVRVIPRTATHAERDLINRAQVGDVETVLLRSAQQGSGTAVNQPLLYALSTGTLGAGDSIRIGDGSRAEYRQIASVSGGARHVTLNAPLAGAHSVGVQLTAVAPGVADTVNYAAGLFQLDDDAPAGSTSILVRIATVGGVAADLTTIIGTPPPGDHLFEVGTSPNAEYAEATNAVAESATQVRITLAQPLVGDYNADDAATATRILSTETLALDAQTGDLILYLGNVGPNFASPNAVVVNLGNAGNESRLVGVLSEIDLDLGAYADYGVSSLIQRINMNDDNREVVGVSNTVIEFNLNVVDGFGVDGLAVGMEIDVGGETAVIAAIDLVDHRITLQSALSSIPVLGALVTLPGSRLTAAAAAGDVVLSLDSRLGLQVDDVLRIGTLPDEEYVTIADVSGEHDIAPDPGTVVLTAPLRQRHDALAEVRRQAPEVDSAVQDARTVLNTGEGENEIYMTDGSGYNTGEVIRLTLPSGPIYYHTLSAVDTTLNAREIELIDALDLTHEAGQPLVQRTPLIMVRALDRGAWGNRLRVAVADEENGLASNAKVDTANSAREIQLSTVTGMEAGTVLELMSAEGEPIVGPLLKVRSVDRTSNRIVTLDAPGLTGGQMSAIATATEPFKVRSREFSLTVYLLDRPHPAVPSRSASVLDSETFRALSMDPRHSRYIHKIIGTTWDAINPEDHDDVPLRLWDQRSEGESAYIRVRDLTPDESVRLGPESLVDVLAGGRERPARYHLVRGGDAAATMGHKMYEGEDKDEPRLRKGIYAFKNIPEISLVLAPGQTTSFVQQALIDHCESDRYRFAILDAHGPNNDSLADVQNQRQQFDTTYASLYHPWGTIPEPMPENLSNIRQIPLPLSGHVAGVYARTDNQRGVHKAPANEILRGITGLTRSLNKGEHDILNPFPRNINVVRDFRPDNRGIRVWGARVITSDPDYKYVPVRRLLIFLEHSIDRGLQWVVFEPNAEPLWARVRRAITNFCTVVWRNGALEGVTVEQAFFVKCDRTTMTQTDIDNGRLICVIGVAPVKPAEFVIIRIGLWTADANQQ